MKCTAALREQGKREEVVAATETGLGRPRLQVYQIHKTIYNGSVDKKRHIEREKGEGGCEVVGATVASPGR